MWKYKARNIHTIVEDEITSHMSKHVQSSSPESVMSGFYIISEELLGIHITPLFD